MSKDTLASLRAEVIMLRSRLTQAIEARDEALALVEEEREKALRLKSQLAEARVRFDALHHLGKAISHLVS